MNNVLESIRTIKVDVGPMLGLEGLETPESGVDIDKLPSGLAVDLTLLDLSAIADPEVRSGISLAMLFASRAAAASGATDPDSWLAAYQSTLAVLGFNISGGGIVRSRLRRTNVSVHKSIVPFLTIAFGGAGVGPIILALLENLKEDENQPWITLFDRESRRFDVQEMHFGAARAVGNNVEVRYVVARLNLELGTTKVLFFKVESASSDFESQTTTMLVNGSLMAVVEPELLARLGGVAKKRIWEIKIAD